MYQQDQTAQLAQGIQDLAPGDPRRILYAQALMQMLPPQGNGPTPVEMEQHHAQLAQQQAAPNSPAVLQAQAARAGMPGPMGAPQQAMPPQMPQGGQMPQAAASQQLRAMLERAMAGGGR